MNNIMPRSWLGTYHTERESTGLGWGYGHTEGQHRPWLGVWSHRGTAQALAGGMVTQRGTAQALAGGMVTQRDSTGLGWGYGHTEGQHRPWLGVWSHRGTAQALAGGMVTQRDSTGLGWGYGHTERDSTGLGWGYGHTEGQHRPWLGVWSHRGTAQALAGGMVTQI